MNVLLLEVGAFAGKLLYDSEQTMAIDVELLL
jgi:hypothetical protein